MIITLKNTTSAEVASRIVELRDERGSAALSRVLTLLICVPDMIDVDKAIEVSDAVSREHPCRVIVIVEPESSEGAALLNAQIRVGDAAGLSDIIILEPRGEAASNIDSLVMPLLQSDTPVVTYWPVTPPENPGAHPLGRLAVKRITDSRATQCPMETLSALSRVYTPGDIDLAWAGVTLWRALLAAVAEDFDRLPTSIRVAGNATHPSPFLVAAWLHHQLGVPVDRIVDREAHTITDITFFFDDDTTVSLSRSATSSVARLSRPGLEDRSVNLARRSVQDSLMEDLRRLDPDVYYGQLLTTELPRLAACSSEG
ncbi:putative glucose-6-phosphate dehydrogenase assembly protein OpcA [Actinomyces sp. ICM58]|uniref:glucose-6-phosphate dehydrogenase assembly protein OpcA n=1 Tax=Actinomyces sp. ICM58 TaxID=1105030 RepID=UPI0002771185|nr:glucose-6-phosphate dehydrogenase assembly protein OpcA [Actinomyces sp. ICM58]EJN52661.1 putative glucose-6-phosphate dehydrogenase assembly protein OpcA [Actinomyces sp. ICM58]